MKPLKLAFFYGAFLILIMLVIAVFFPRPTSFQYTVFRIVLAVAAAGVGAEIPGILKVKCKWLNASGALAVFVIVYYHSPAKLVVQEEVEKLHKELGSIKENTGETKNVTREIKNQNEILLAAIRELPQAVAQTIRQAESIEDEPTRIARAYAILEEKFKLPKEFLVKEIPIIAAQLVQRNDKSLLDSALGLFALKKFPDAERAALDAKKKSLDIAGQPVKDAISALELAGLSAFAQCQYKQAMNHFREAAILVNKNSDPLEWARIHHLIAILLIEQGEYSQAVEIEKSVLNIRTQMQGSKNPETLSSRNTLADAMYEQGKFDEVEKEHRSILALRLLVLGPEHPDTLLSRNNLACALASLGKYFEAETEHLAVLSIRERNLGPEHPDTLSSRVNLAIVMDVQGRHEEAAKEHLAILRILERILNPDNILVLKNRFNLAVAFDEQGKSNEAENEFRIVLAGYERFLGTNHPLYFNCCYDLAICLKAQNKFSEASSLAKRAYEGLLLKLGNENDTTKKAYILVREFESK